MDTLKKNSSTIAIIAGAAAVAGCVYLLFKKSKDEDQVEIVDETVSSLSATERAAVLGAIRVEYDGDNLTIATIGQICDATLQFAAPQFVALTLKDRADRRRNKQNVQRYIELWDEYATHLEEIIEGTQRDVLRQLNISDAAWEASNSFYMGQGNHELMMLHASLPQKLKMNLKPTKVLTKEEFKTVLKAQVDFLNAEAENAGELSSFIKRPEEVAPVIQNRVNDRIAEEYAVEEEDVFMSMRQYMMDPEIQQIFMQLQQATMKLMPMGGGYF